MSFEKSLETEIKTVFSQGPIAGLAGGVGSLETLLDFYRGISGVRPF
mgnify:FL=1